MSREERYLLAHGADKFPLFEDRAMRMNHSGENEEYSGDSHPAHVYLTPM